MPFFSPGHLHAEALVKLQVDACLVDSAPELLAYIWLEKFSWLALTVQPTDHAPGPQSSCCQLAATGYNAIMPTPRRHDC